MNELQRRVAAVQATQARFVGRPFSWGTSGNCIRMISFHARRMGHQLPLVPRFRSAVGAVKALRAEGVETLPELMDKYFPRIPAAQMLAGDVAAFPGEGGGLDGLMIYGQLRAVLGWHPYSDECQYARLTDEGYAACAGAWRL